MVDSPSFVDLANNPRDELDGKNEEIPDGGRNLERVDSLQGVRILAPQ